MNQKIHDAEKIVDAIHKRYRDYSMYATDWQVAGQEDREFRLGRQWTVAQEEELALKGQSPIVVNRIMPAVETAKAMLTANRPSFRTSPREDSDNKVAQVFNGLLEYMYQQSDGETEMRQCIDDYYVIGMGVIQIYQDPTADLGKGEIYMRALDPFTVYLDPNTRSRFADDSSHIVVSKNFSKDQALQIYSMYRDAIQAASGQYESDVPSTDLYDNGEIFFGDTFTAEDEYVRGYEDYTKIIQYNYRVFETFSGKEDVIPEVEWDGYLARPALIIDGNIITGFEQILQAKEAIQQQTAAYDGQLQELQKQRELALREIDLSVQERILAMTEQARSSDIAAERIQLETDKANLDAQQQIDAINAQFQQAVDQIKPPSKVRDVTYKTLVDMDLISLVRVPLTRIQLDVVIGDKFLYRRVMPIEYYPVIPIMNGFTRSAYPTSDVRAVKRLQQYINKVRSLVMSHAASSTNLKILVPAGSVDVTEFEEKWNAAGTGVLEIDMDEGTQPMIPQLPQLPTALYQSEQQAKNDIDHQLGLYELMQGNAAAAPQTYKATVALDEFGQRKIRSKQMDIEGGLRRMGQVAIPLMQQLWTSEKIARVVQPNNSITEYAINKRLYDDKSQEIGVMNDITRGAYDVIVVAGSTLPTNRFAQLEFYMDAYEKGIIDRQEVLKKTEVFDAEGVLKRVDEIGNLQQQLQQATDAISTLEGDIQTKDRELSHLQKRVETEKFKADLKDNKTKLEASGELWKQRLNDALKEARKQAKENTPSK